VCALLGECEKASLVERIRAGMRRAKLKGQRLGRAPLDVDRAAIVQDRLSGMSLTQTAKHHRVSRATVVRLVREAKQQDLVAAA
jgi:DNA invertase Pin-like site-specific DNA recombinase